MVGPESFQPQASVKSFRSPSGRERSGRRRLRGGHRRSKSEGQKGISIGFVKHGRRPFCSVAAGGGETVWRDATRCLFR